MSLSNVSSSRLPADSDSVLGVTAWPLVLVLLAFTKKGLYLSRILPTPMLKEWKNASLLVPVLTKEAPTCVTLLRHHLQTRTN